MATTIDLPADQGDSGSWGPKLNIAITAVRDAADAAQTSATAADTKATSARTLARPPHNKVGFWYSPQTVAGSNVLTQASVGYFVPYYFDKTVSIDRAQINVNAAGAAGSVVRSAIYADNGSGKPTGAPLGVIGAFDTTSTGLKLITLGSPIALPAPGLYWVFSQIEVAAPNLTNLNENMPPVPQAEQPNIVSCAWQVVTADGAVPASVDPAAVTGITYRGPIMRLRLSAAS